MSRKYKFQNPTAAYFVSFATVYWLNVFVREEYFGILAASVNFCRKEKGMEIYAYCFIPRHACPELRRRVHFIFRDSNGNPTALLRDFKKYTAKRIISAIEENPQEGIREWLLWMFERAGKNKGNVAKYQFWQHHNKPIELWNTSVIKQKIDYVHNNPVESGFVTEPTEWKYSSARIFAGDDTI